MTANMAGRPGAAAASLRAALSALDRTEPSVAATTIRFNCLVTGALTSYLTGGLGAATDALDEASAYLAELVPGLAERLSPRLEFQRASILGRAGSFEAALRSAQVAMRHPASFTTEEQAAVLLLSGLVLGELGHSSESTAALAEAARRAREAGSTQLEQAIRHDLWFAAYQRGDLPEALSWVGISEDSTAQLSRLTALLDQAFILLEAGLLDDAVDRLRQATTMRSRRDDPQVRAEVDYELARTLRLVGDVAGARHHAHIAVRRFRRLHLTAWEARVRLLQVELALDGPGHPGRPVLRTAEWAATVAAEHGDEILLERARTVLAHVQLRRGDLDAARRTTSVAPGRIYRPLTHDLERTLVNAQLRRQTGDDRGAAVLLRRAARTLAEAQEVSPGLDLRTAGAFHGVRLGELDLDLAIRRGPRAVLASLDRWRSATDHLPIVRPPRDPDAASLVEQLRGVLVELGQAQQPEDRRRLQADALVLRRRVRARTWALRSPEEQEADASHPSGRIDEVLEGNDRDLVWLAEHRGRIVGVALRRGRAAFRDLMSAHEAAELLQRVRSDLEVACTHHLGPLSGAVWASLVDELEALDRALVRPWGSSERGLVVVCSGALAVLPWSGLPSLADRPLTVARSTTAYVRGSMRSAPVSRVDVAVGPGIPHPDAEAAAVREAWASHRARVHDEQTAEGLLASFGSAEVVHVAAHGHHEAMSPLFSTLDLHGGPLFAHELQPAGVRSSHVFLSACELGAATLRPGDEPLGFTSALLALGARSVVAATTPVPHEVATAVATRCHELVAAGYPVGEALAVAVASSDRLAMAFSAFGADWSARIPSDSPGVSQIRTAPGEARTGVAVS
ncbi:CHAT domain-containing protein [Nostocoides japonicum]|uniref:CHAT domain-containing protein n=1 Tax=Nostocoides japonicum TaxID=99481 RepID=UPI00138EEC44|nr:CHAT domain-containing protein [Tetrasphaera japonica]